MTLAVPSTDPCRRCSIQRPGSIESSVTGARHGTARGIFRLYSVLPTTQPPAYGAPIYRGQGARLVSLNSKSSRALLDQTFSPCSLLCFLEAKEEEADHGGPCQGRAGADRPACGGCAAGPRAGDRPVRRPGARPRGRGARAGVRVRGAGLLQGDRARGAAGARARRGGGRGGVLRAAAGREGGRRGAAARVRQQAHRRLRRPRVDRVRHAGRHPRRRAARRLLHVLDIAVRGRRRRVASRAPLPLTGSSGGVRGGGAADGVRRAGADGGGAGDRAGGRAVPAGGRRGERQHAPGEPLPAAAGAAGEGPDGVRRAHGPADRLRAPLQRHLRAGDLRARRLLGRRAARRRLLLHQRRRRPPGADEREVQEREAQGGGEQREAEGVHGLLRRPAVRREAGAAAPAAGGRRPDPLQGVRLEGVQEQQPQGQARHRPPLQLRELAGDQLSDSDRLASVRYVYTAAYILYLCVCVMNAWS